MRTAAQARDITTRFADPLDEDEAMTDPHDPGASLAGRLAARAVALCLDAANALEDVADHLVRLSCGDALSLRRAVRQVERRQDHPASAPAQLAIRALRMAVSRAVEAPSASAARSGALALPGDPGRRDGGSPLTSGAAAVAAYGAGRWMPLTSRRAR